MFTMRTRSGKELHYPGFHDVEGPKSEGSGRGGQITSPIPNVTRIALPFLCVRFTVQITQSHFPSGKFRVENRQIPVPNLTPSGPTM